MRREENHGLRMLNIYNFGGDQILRIYDYS